MLKKVVAIIVLVAIASLSVAGCTTSTTNTTNPTPQPPADTAKAITDEFSQAGFIIITPFVKSTNAGIVTYKGVVKDGQKTLTPYLHNLTLEVTKDRNDTAARFDTWVRYATEHGYTGYSSDAGIARYWQSGTQGAVTNATHGVWIVAQQPKAFVTVVYATQPPMDVATLSDSFFVAADFATKA